MPKHYPKHYATKEKIAQDCTLAPFFEIKFIYFEKATKFCEIFTLFLSYVVPVKSKVKISQNYVAFSEYMNFRWLWKSESTLMIALGFPIGTTVDLVS